MLTPALAVRGPLSKSAEPLLVASREQDGRTADDQVAPLGGCLTTYLQRYEAIYRQASAQYGGMEALLPAPAVSEKALSRSKRRAVPEVREPGTSAAPERDDVEIVSLPTVSIKKAYSTVDILRAISSARSPFKYSAAMAMDLYAVASSETVNAERRELLLTFAEWFDGVASLDPRIMLMQGFSDAARMAADILEGKTLTPEDMLGLTNTFKVTMTIRRFSPSSVERMKKMTEKALANVKAGDKTDTKALPAVKLVEGKVRELPRRRPITMSVGVISYGYFNALGSRLTPVPERVRPVIGEAVAHDVEPPVPVDLGGDAQPDWPIHIEEQPPEVHDEHARQEEVLAQIPLPAPPLAEGELPLANEHDGVGKHVELEAVVEAPVEEQAQEKLPSNFGVGEGEHDDEHVVETLDPEEEADVRFFDLAYAESAELEVESRADQNDASSGSESRAPSARLEYALTDGIPFFREADEHGFVRLRPMPIERYRADGIQGRDEPGVFYVQDSAYAQFGEYCYAVRSFGRDDWHIVSRRDRLLPPLPLAWEGQQLVFRRPVPVVFSGAEAAAIEGREAADGFTRYGNRKFALVNGMLVAVDRVNIVGEKTVASLAITIEGHVGPADAMGIINTSEYGAVIEGAHGYYRLLQDSAFERFFLAGEHGDRQTEVEYDVDTNMWRIVDDHTVGAVIDEDLIDRTAAIDLSSTNADGVDVVRPEFDAPPEREAPRLPTVVVDDVDGAIEAAAGPSEEHSPEERDALMVAVRKWSASSADSLERYRLQAMSMSFLERRPLLRRRIRKAFKALGEANLQRSNRLSAHGASSTSTIPIGHIRAQIFQYMPGEKKWSKMTIRQKQRSSAEAAFQVYLADAGKWYFFEPTAFCHEMADMTLWYIVWHRRFKERILQVAFRDLSGSGMRHVALIYSEFPQLLERFGDLDSTHLPDQVGRPTLNREQFEQFLFDQRGEVMLIDPWASEKLLDFSRSTHLTDVQAPLQSNLHEAKFSIELPLNYEVRAVLPSRTQS